MIERSLEEIKGRGGLRVDDEDSRSLGQVERDTTRFERDEKDLNVGVVHEVLNRSLALHRAHTAVQHDGLEARAAEAPFHELQHGRELREDDGFVGLLLAAQLVEIVHQHLDLRARGPVLHLDAVDDGALLHVIFVLLDVGLVEIDGQRYMAARTVWSVAVVEGTDIVLGAFAAEFMMAARADGFFSCFVADAADEDVLTAFGVLFED